MKTRYRVGLSLIAIALLTGGCSQQQAATPVVSESSSVKSSVVDDGSADKIKALEAELAKSKKALAEAKTASSSTPVETKRDVSSDIDLPPAKPGQCFTKAFFPPKYKTTTEKVLATEASEKIEVIPATYKTVKEKVLVGEASERVEILPAVYGTQTETIEVSPEELIWRVAKDSKSARASQVVLDAAKKGGIDLASAKVGSCYHEHYLAPKYKTVTEKMLASEASEKLEVIPAKYELVNEKVLVSEASTRLETIPAKYKTVSEKVQIEPAKQIWKKTPCLDEGCDNQEILCLVDVPAKYRTVTKTVLVEPAKTKTVQIPAKYKTVKVNKLVSPATTRAIPIPETYKSVTHTEKVSDGEYIWHPVNENNPLTPPSTRTGNVICLTKTPAKYKKVSKTVVKTPASSKTITIPAKYKTVEVVKLDKPAQEKRIPIPATYKTVTKTELIADGYTKWVPIVCKSNMTTTTIKNVQKALKDVGFYKGPIDGIWGSQSRAAVKAYQKSKNLPLSGLSVEVMEKLGLY